MKKITVSFLACFFLLVGCSPASSNDLDLGDLIELNTNAQGGKASLEKLQSVWSQRKSNLFTVRLRPKFHMVVMTNEEDGSVFYAEGYNGDVAWEQYDSPSRVEKEGRPKTALWQTTQFPRALNPLYRVIDNGHSLELLGREEIEGINYYKILLTLSNGFETHYYINPDSHHIERSRNIRREHAYQENVQPIETVWGDFRSIDGVMFPYSSMERNYETGEVFYQGQMMAIKTNIGIDEADFSIDGGYETILLAGDAE